MMPISWYVNGVRDTHRTHRRITICSYFKNIMAYVNLNEHDCITLTCEHSKKVLVIVFTKCVSPQYFPGFCLFLLHVKYFVGQTKGLSNGG